MCAAFLRYTSPVPYSPTTYNFSFWHSFFVLYNPNSSACKKSHSCCFSSTPFLPAYVRGCCDCMRILVQGRCLERIDAMNPNRTEHLFWKFVRCIALNNESNIAGQRTHVPATNANDSLGGIARITNI